VSGNRLAAAALAFAALLGAGCGREEPRDRAGTPPAPAAPAAAGTVVAFGDSLTAGYGLAAEQAWPALLEARLAAEGLPWRVVNAGISGETSSGALARVDWVLRQLRPDVVLLATGGNDGLRGLETRLLRENLRAAVRRLQAGGATVVLAGMRMVGNLGEVYTREFAAVYPTVARETGAALVPFLLEGVAAVPALNLPDGIHPNAEGQRRIAETVYPHVRRAIEAQRAGRAAGGVVGVAR
jgi:acyl-CoA thioesterase-1